MTINFFVEYVETARKRIYKYLKLIFKKDYDPEIADVYVENYINSRYYNLAYKENNRIFYLRIKETLLKSNITSFGMCLSISLSSFLLIFCTAYSSMSSSSLNINCLSSFL